MVLRAAELGSDGCTGVLDLFMWTCLEHDVHYRTHRTALGDSLTFEEANYIFRERIKQVRVTMNPLTWIKYPVAYARWYVVGFARKAWNHD